LPDLSLSWDRSDSADLLLEESVDDGGLSGIGSADQSNRDLFSIRMEGRELSK
jgi:hypothetical protein